MADEAPDNSAYDSDGFRNSGDDSSPDPRSSPFPDKTVEPVPAEVQPETPGAVVDAALTEAGLSTNPTTRLTEIQDLMAEGDFGPYWKGPHADALQAEYRNLLDRQDGGDSRETAEGLVEVEGIETPTIADARAMAPALDEDAARTAIDTAMTIAGLVPAEDRVFFESAFAGLADGTRAAIVMALGTPAPERAEPASDNVLQTLKDKGCGEFLAEWGIGAARRIGIANARVNAVIDSLETDEDAKEFVRFFDNQSGPELTAILRMIA